MKKYFIMLFGILMLSTANAQNNPGNSSDDNSSKPVVGKSTGSPANSNKGKLEVGRDNSTVNSTDGNKADRAMVSNNTANNAGLPEKKSGQIPDGTYGTNTTGQVYAPSNPNFPYDRNGKLLPSVKKSEVIFSSPTVQNASSSKKQAVTSVQKQ